MATLEEMQTWQERADDAWKEAERGSIQEVLWFQQGTLAELCLQLVETNKQLKRIADLLQHGLPVEHVSKEQGGTVTQATSN